MYLSDKNPATGRIYPKVWALLFPHLLAKFIVSVGKSTEGGLDKNKSSVILPLVKITIWRPFKSHLRNIKTQVAVVDVHSAIPVEKHTVWPTPLVDQLPLSNIAIKLVNPYFWTRLFSLIVGCIIYYSIPIKSHLIPINFPLNYIKCPFLMSIKSPQNFLFHQNLLNVHWIMVNVHGFPLNVH